MNRLDLSSVLSEIKEIDKLIKESLPNIRKTQLIERERIFEEAGSPGFDGPTKIMTDLDESILKLNKASQMINDLLKKK